MSLLVDRDKVQIVFENYISGYEMSNNMIRLKAEHTYRVANLCEQIAMELNLTKEDVNLAWLIGMFHDLGRFTQWKNYGTFQDAVSVDHAKLSEKLLFDDQMIEAFLDDRSEDELIRLAVSTHNMYRLPQELDERQLQFCNILRDADKIDIFKVNVDFSLEEIYSCTTEDILYSEISDEVMACVREGHAVLRSLKKTGVDHIVGHICLAFELVYPISRKILLEQGYLNKLLSFESENPKTKEDFMKIREYVLTSLNRVL